MKTIMNELLNNYCEAYQQFDSNYIRIVTNKDIRIDIKINNKKSITLINADTNEITNIININTLIPALKLKKWI
ncbi:MAG: hypothetical protein J6D47_07260 [Peptostreptococcaceae bacterium]|nr:hypothetical protein [Peptostreptococcaceae bacterium]